MSLTIDQDHSIAVAMRICGAISLVGCLFVVLTFTLSRRFRRPVNRLIFYASLGNLILAVVGILSVDPIYPPYGADSALCTAQGFLVQMFLPADALWNLAMAINVYLTIFKRWEVERLKRLEFIYAGCNFGIPFVVAVAYLFVNDSVRGRIYGPASIWCWISPEWEWLRIGLLYAPSWICIIIIVGIYVAAGLFIYEKRKGLNSARVTPPSFKRSSFVPLRGNSPKSAPNPFAATKTTHIKITSEPSAPHGVFELTSTTGTKKSQDSDSVDGATEAPSHRGKAQMSDSNNLGEPARTYEPYTVTINGGSSHEVDNDIERGPMTPTISNDPEAERSLSFDNELLSPVSAHHPPFSRHMSTYSRSGVQDQSSRSRSRGNDTQRRQTAAAQRQQTHVAWSYTKVALLYFLSLLSTWVPSSVNRVYSLVHENEVNFGLSMAAAFVLPLVGFWNALIYGVTSFDAVTEVWWEGVDWVSGHGRGRARRR